MKTNILLTIAICLAAIGAVTVPERHNQADRTGQPNQQITPHEKQNDGEPVKHEVVFFTIQDGFKATYSTNGTITTIVSGPNGHFINNVSSSAGAPQYIPSSYTYSFYTNNWNAGVPDSYSSTNDPKNVAQIIADLLNDGYKLVNYTSPNSSEYYHANPTVLLVK